jgi:hypothetical protein
MITGEIAGLDGEAAGQVGGDGGKKQLSSCGIGLFLANSAALVLKCMFSLRILARFHDDKATWPGGVAGAMAMRADGWFPMLGQPRR